MRNIIITGGELFNKGAQAMTFITVDEIRKRFPQHHIYVLSDMDLQRPRSEREQYTFDFMGWYPMKFARCQKNPLLRILCTLSSGRELKEAEEIYKNTDMMIDISGYALGSVWNYHYCNLYLEHLEFAKAFDIPVYLMPQSFGPFDFMGEKGKELDERVRKLLPGVKRICAREQEGYDMLVDTYHLDNVCIKGDIVLNNRGIELTNIYRQIPELSLPKIAKKSIAIIPNGQAIKVGNREHIFQLYHTAIVEMLKKGRTIYLLSHSTPDKEFCQQIKKGFQAEERVVLLEEDFSCIEFNELVKKFEFIIASRFHSIVHAYKNGIPCVVLGWAVKYHELAALFNQERYLFDVRTATQTEEIFKAISEISECFVDESDKIKSLLQDVQKENVFNILSLEK